MKRSRGPDPLDEAPLTFALARLAGLGRRRMHEAFASEAWLKDAGFRPPCVGVMFCIARLEPVSQKRVADTLLLDPSDLVGVVDILERAGFVQRERDPDDRRRHALALTAAGRDALARLRAIAERVTDDLLAPLDERERATLAALIARLVAYHRE
jgi:DNA-binding MarR family transcriptional regulator